MLHVNTCHFHVTPTRGSSMWFSLGPWHLYDGAAIFGGALRSDIGSVFYWKSACGECGYGYLAVDSWPLPRTHTYTAARHDHLTWKKVALTTWRDVGPRKQRVVLKSGVGTWNVVCRMKSTLKFNTGGRGSGYIVCREMMWIGVCVMDKSEVRVRIWSDHVLRWYYDELWYNVNGYSTNSTFIYCSN